MIFQKAAEAFPVFSKRTQIENAFCELPSGGCLVIDAEPGSGKTSLVPLMLASVTPGIILVTEPRRLAAVNAAKFASSLIIPQQKSHCSSANGEDCVGYTVRGEKNITPHTRVIYATEGMALVLLSDPVFVSSLSSLIIDEFHERHSSTDTLILLMRLWSSSAKLKFVLMSATFDEEKYSNLFNVQRTLKISGQMFPLEILYEGDFDQSSRNTVSQGVSHFSSGNPFRSKNEQLINFVCRVIVRELKQISEEAKITEKKFR